MPVIRSSEVEFTPTMVPNCQRRVLVNPDKGSGAITLGEAIMEPGAELPAHTHRVEEVMVLTTGTAIALLGDETYTLKPGDVVLAPAGVKHMLANRSQKAARFLFFYPAVEVRLDSVSS